MKVEPLPTYRPDCSECHCPMDGHFGDGSDAGCWAESDGKPCQCRGYRFAWEVEGEQ